MLDIKCTFLYSVNSFLVTMLIYFLSVGDNIYMKVYIVAIASLRRERDIRKT